MNNTSLMNILNSDNSNIVFINTQYCQMIKFESMIKKPIVANHTFFAVVYPGIFKPRKLV